MKKTLMIMLALVLVIAMSVSATLAYLTDDATVTNTFTVGNVIITLDEAPVDLYGEVVAGDRRGSNEYKLIPGHTYTKDPQVHVDADSEKCWLFVDVVNGISGFEVAAADGDTIIEQMIANDWAPVSEGSSIYAYESIVNPGATVDVFETFTVAGDATISNPEPIVVTAYAIQADGFDTAAAAWEAADLT